MAFYPKQPTFSLNGLSAQWPETLDLGGRHRGSPGSRVGSEDTPYHWVGTPMALPHAKLLCKDPDLLSCPLIQAEATFPPAGVPGTDPHISYQFLLTSLGRR